MADDEQNDDHNDDPHHPALLEKGYESLYNHFKFL